MSDATPEVTPEIRGRAALGERIWYGALSVAAVLVLAVAVITTAAASQSTCVACHGAEAHRLSSGAHVSTQCADCHSGTTTLGVLDSRLRVVDMVGAAIVGRKAGSATQRVDETRCLSCHPVATLSRTTESKGLRMNHRTPIDKGMACTSCHKGTGHGRGVDRSFGYSMDTCMTCHKSDPSDVKSCEVCHSAGAGGAAAPTEPTPWRVTHGPSWRTMHGMGDLTTCRSCHDQRTCLECHNVPVPHATGYLGDHGPQVLALAPSERQGCMTCHTKYSCDNCHGIEMPHPRDFLKGHASLAAKGKATCMRCHTESSCTECHVKHTHPGLTDAWKRALINDPVKSK